MFVEIAIYTGVTVLTSIIFILLICLTSEFVKGYKKSKSLVDKILNIFFPTLAWFLTIIALLAMLEYALLGG